MRTVLSAVMSYAAAMEYVESTRWGRFPHPGGPCRTGWRRTVEETARILLTAEEKDPDFLTFLWVAAEEGGRRGDVLALRWRDVDHVFCSVLYHGPPSFAEPLTAGSVPLPRTW
jgi:integrase